MQGPGMSMPILTTKLHIPQAFAQAQRLRLL
jgi:hypothetical protein